jgi:hypothetical protein
MRCDECRAFGDQRLERLRAEELEVHAPVVAEPHGEPILAEPGEAHLVDLESAVPADTAQRSVSRVLGVDTMDSLVRAQCDARRQVARHGHAGDDVYVDEPLLDEDVARVFVVVRPAQRERVRPFPAGG